MQQALLSPLTGTSFGGFSGCFGTSIYPRFPVLFRFDKSIYWEIRSCRIKLIKASF